MARRTGVASSYPTPTSAARPRHGRRDRRSTGLGGLAAGEDQGHGHDHADHEDGVDRPALTCSEQPLLRSHLLRLLLGGLLCRLPTHLTAKLLNTSPRLYSSASSTSVELASRARCLRSRTFARVSMSHASSSQ